MCYNAILTNGFSRHLLFAEIGLVANFVIAVHTYYIGGALLKKVNGDVWKNVVIGGGLLGGLIVEYIG